MATVPWTEDRVRYLKRRWAEGVPAAKIAEELGDTTRNAVIGKAYRLELSKKSGRGRSSSAKGESGKGSGGNANPHSVESTDAGVAGTTGDTSGGGHFAQGRDSTDLGAPGSTHSPADEADLARENVVKAESKSRRLTVMDITERTCKWPIGDPATSDFWFCGLPSQPGKPYCSAHIAVAFQPFTSRKDRRARQKSAIQIKHKR